MLSDRWGRRVWLLAGTAFFAGVPFVYHFVDTPGQLFAARIVHGTATAIYGPVTLAYVAELSPGRVAERLGWFGMARNAGYVIGPAVGGALLLSMSPEAIFTVIGLVSIIAFVPVMLLREPPGPRAERGVPVIAQIGRSLGGGLRSPAVWLAGAMEAAVYVPLYALKVFVPIYALAAGVNVALVGTFFALQAGAHMALSPVGGRIADRAGHARAFGAGIALLGVTLAYLATIGHGIAFLLPAVLVGVSQALVLPAAMAWLAGRARPGGLGAGMGLVGTLRNGGKVAGPALAGLLIHWFNYAATLQGMGLVLVVAAALVWAPSIAGPRRERKRRAPVRT
ncbi:MAG: MFS transporter [Dehalococcoidia bacterium]